MTATHPIIGREEFDRVVADPARTLPGHAYHSSAFFDAEVEHLFKAQWFPVAHEQMVPTAGDFYTLDLWGIKLVIVRGDDGDIRALDRRCLQTGRDLFLNPFTQGHCDTVLGNVLGHRSWIYNLQGRVIESDVAREEHALPRYALENWQGFLLINIDGKASPYEPELATMATGLKNYRINELTLIREPVVFDMEANWKLVAENYIEAYHHLATHRNTFEKVSPARSTYTDDLTDKVISLNMPIEVDFEQAFDWTLPPIGSLEEADRATFSAYLALPLFLLTPLHNSLAWLHLIPVSAERSFWMIYILAPAEYLEREDDVRKLVSSGIEIHNEDMDACIGNHKGFRSRFFDQGYVHPDLEKGVSLLDRHVLEAIAKGDPALVGN